MYIKRVTIENIRCFEKVAIDFTSPQGIRMWNMIVGDNGMGKTTLLRSIAMGLGDATSAAALHRELYGDWIRIHAGKKGKATIKIEFESDRNARNSPWIKTTIERTPSGYSEVDQETNPKNFPWEDIFVCGYGAARRGFGTKDYDDYSAIDAVYTLFNYDSPLQNPELIMYRLLQTGISRSTILGWVNNILMLPEGSISFERSGIGIKRPEGKFVTIGGVGDGHSSTLAWIMDMLGWALFYDDKQIKKSISGIVLVDEIEQHLHPSWQKQIVKLLQSQFPCVQFITTTHTPLCAIGMTALKDEESQLVLLLPRYDSVEVIDKQRAPRGKRADQVLTSSLFGLRTSGDEMIKDQIEQYSRLNSKQRKTQKEQKEMRLIQKYLDKTLGTAETNLERQVAQAIKRTLKKRPKLRKYPKQSISYEVKRQLKNLLKSDQEI